MYGFNIEGFLFFKALFPVTEKGPNSQKTLKLIIQCLMEKKHPFGANLIMSNSLKSNKGTNIVTRIDRYF